MYGFAILSSVTYRQAISFALQHFQLATPLVDVAFRDEHGSAKWTFLAIPDPRIDSTLNRFLVELEMAAVLTIHRDVMGAAFVPRAAHFTFAAPRDAQIYPHMLGCAVMFDRAENQFVFDPGWLDKVPQLGNAMTYAEVVKLCDVLMDEMRLRIGLSGKVREVLLHNVMRPVSLESVARQLHMTGRTLRRRLRRENTSFRQLTDDLRKRLAIKYLDETDLVIEEVAHSLGFSEDASFRHAFRRWTNAAPAEFRARLRKSKVPAVAVDLPLIRPAARQRSA
jgi:AraC-like DNA-binding protein